MQYYGTFYTVGFNFLYNMIYIPTEEERATHIQSEDKNEKRLFDPPLYKQRYLAVTEIINQYEAKSVLDMGCSEGQLLNHIKDQCSTVEEIIGIDIDHETLKRNVFRLQPSTFEFIIKRLSPLKMALYQGSIGEFDSKFTGVDVIACIEVIEHLYDDVLQLVPECLFGLMKPKVAVISTPNCEYNVLFKDFSGMRHTDHKFEWTRKEFKNWCQNIVDTYDDYIVKYSGVGEPTDDRDVGYCSQIAVFTSCTIGLKKDSAQNVEKVGSTDSLITKTNRKHINEAHYDLISEIIYPYEDVNINKSEKIMHEIEYVTYQYFSSVLEEEENRCKFTKEISIDKLLIFPGFAKFNVNKTDIVRLFGEELSTNNLSLSDDKEQIVVSFDMTQYESDSDDSEDDKENENEGSCVVVDYVEEEDWT